MKPAEKCSYDAVIRTLHDVRHKLQRAARFGKLTPHGEEVLALVLSHIDGWQMLELEREQTVIGE